MTVYYTGFAIQVDAVLQVAGADLPPGSLVITAALVKPDRSGLASGSTVVTCSKPGGNVVRATWSAAQSAAIQPGHYEVEFRTNDGPFCHEGVRIELRAGVSP